jgi:ABC-2 type transport system ATP-binding protein
MYIEVKNYTKKIKGSVVLSNINIRFESGNIYGLKGKNGSGKTMLMRAVSGLIHPTEGVVDINGQILGQEISYPPSLGLLLENPAFLPNETGFVNLKILSGLKGIITDHDICDTMREVGLEPEDGRTYRKYSLGMRQKLGIAAAIMEQPDLIILDEPINALDEETVEKVKRLIIRERDRGAIIILAAHDTEELEYLADCIVPISEGKIGTVQK